MRLDFSFIQQKCGNFLMNFTKSGVNRVQFIFICTLMLYYTLTNTLFLYCLTFLKHKKAQNNLCYKQMLLNRQILNRNCHNLAKPWQQTPNECHFCNSFSLQKQVKTNHVQVNIVLAHDFNITNLQYFKIKQYYNLNSSSFTILPKSKSPKF